MKTTLFDEAYKSLNSAQKEAVDTIDGPVMVVAGPGTGKTQVLALRIATLLEKTDTPANGILCLTFTRAGVRAMRDRLARYIGSRAREVSISTFHSFAISLVEKHYELLDFASVPTLLDTEHSVALFDELLENGEWQYLRPRGDVSRYFSDLTSLVSLLKRERITPEKFLSEIDKDIKTLTESPESISSRGETKGQIKKEVQKKIDSLERTREAISFYKKYEEIKHERSLMDYDDVLEYAVRLVEEFEDVRSDIRENYLYVLVDEHQDSSGIQNAFLKAVWQNTEQPNIFAVGDDRQLIYGFGGASVHYFEEFKTAFGRSKLISLVENYRSTGPILSLADTLLQSSLTGENLRSQKEGEKVTLAEYSYERDEIIAAGIYFKKKINDGVPPEECVLLVPRNRHIRSAVTTLRSMGLPIRSEGNVSLFSLRETESLRDIFRIVADPSDAVALSRSIFSPLSEIAALDAHTFLKSVKARDLSVDMLASYGESGNLFSGESSINLWGKKLIHWINQSTSIGLVPLIQKIGNEYLIDSATDHESLTRRIEILRTMLHLASARVEHTPSEDLASFVRYLDRLETYGQTITVATLLGGQGVSVLTLHGSKGLEFETVWVAHLNESVLMSAKRLGFAVPESVSHLIEERDRSVATREVYVAITRAKEECTISYARSNTKEGELELAYLLADLPESHFIKKSAEETESLLVGDDPKVYVAMDTPLSSSSDRDQLIESVTDSYEERKVSVTLLNNFFECPWKWYFRNVLDLPEEKTEHQLFGSAVHRALEKILKGELAPQKNKINEALIEFLEKEGIREETALKRLSIDGVRVVLAWAERFLPTIAKDHTTERSISYKDPNFPHLHLYGKIDLTERTPDGSISVTDFKTGSSKTRSVIEKRDEEGRLSPHLRQLTMYAYLIKGTEKKDVEESKLLYVEEDSDEKNSVYRTRITTEEIDLLKKDIADYDSLATSGKWLDRKCLFKPYGTETECPYCKWALEVYGK